VASEARTGPEGLAATNTPSMRIAERSRQVWLVLTVCLFTFLGVCALSSYGLIGFLGNVAVAKGASVEAPQDASWAVLRHGEREAVRVSGRQTIEEGDTVIADKDGKGIIRLFDESVITIFGSAQIRLDTLRTNEFFGRAQEVHLTLERGTVRVARGARQQPSSQYVVATDLTEVEIEPEARVRFTIEEGDNRLTQVVVESGRATVRSLGEKIELGPKQMAWVSRTEAPQGPLVAEKDLVKNGNFVEGPTSTQEELEEGGLGVAGWQPIRDQGAPPVPAGSVTITDELGLRAARIFYQGGENQFPRVGIVQEINEPTEFYNTIELTATVKLVEQEQAVRGPGGDLYPLIVKIVYTDSEGVQHEWRRSFYIVGDDEDLTDVSRVKLPVGKWESTGEIRQIRQASAEADGKTEVVQLNAELFMLKSAGSNPDVAAIRTIELYGSGIGFQSWVTGISLLAR
jgi:hypothetical protein